MFLGEEIIMNDLILSKMREGDWGEVVRLMRAEYGGSPDPTPAAPKDAPQEMPFRERFETVRVTPRTVADSVVEENGRFSGITFEGERYKPSRRFLKGLAQHFAHIFGGESFARRKPDPLPLLQACRALGSAPRHTLMVGDSVFDAQAARAAGCPFALLDYGYKGGVNAAAISADWRISSLAQLSVLITQVGEEETVSSLQ